MVAATAIMGAHLGSILHGIGQHVDLSLFEIMAGSQDRAVQASARYQYTGVIPERTGGGGGRNILPNGVYPCADGYVQMFAMRPVWKEACLMIDRPDLIEDAHFLDNFAGNAEVKAEFDALLLEWLLVRTKREVMKKAQSVGYICTELKTMDEVFEDPHLRERAFFVQIDHPYTGQLTYPGPPFRMSESPWTGERAPLLGEHTASVLHERLGYGAQDLAVLRETGAI
jgi:crotonobetainyl-CoA:carnitine CoA-transferase CaiB-like acyl-CoA transferase